MYMLATEITYVMEVKKFCINFAMCFYVFTCQQEAVANF